MSIQNIIDRYRKKSRTRRKKVFLDYFRINKKTKLLDIGSETGININYILKGENYKKENIYIADIDQEAISKGQKKYNYTPVLINEEGVIPFPDNYFDITYCSSVIEHVTIPKDKVWTCKDSSLFKKISKDHQQSFINELRRVSKSYFIQTPNKGFIIESHSWLPFLSFFPRPLLIFILKKTNNFWIKKTNPDFYLLNKKEFSKLFKDDLILTERSFFMVKSWMAIKK